MDAKKLDRAAGQRAAVGAGRGQRSVLGITPEWPGRGPAGAHCAGPGARWRPGRASPPARRPAGCGGRAGAWRGGALCAVGGDRHQRNRSGGGAAVGRWSGSASFERGHRDRSGPGAARGQPTRGRRERWRAGAHCLKAPYRGGSQRCRAAAPARRAYCSTHAHCAAVASAAISSNAATSATVEGVCANRRWRFALGRAAWGRARWRQAIAAWRPAAQSG